MTSKPYRMPVKNEWQELVRDFMDKFRQPDAIARPITSPPLAGDRAALRASLILEEANETVSAIMAGDSIGAIDGMVDTIYVVLGTAIEMGVDLDPFFREVHRTNMAKEGGPTRADGKILKPPGWEAPRISEMVQEYNGKIEREEARTPNLRVFVKKEDE